MTNRHAVMVTTVFESAFRVHANRINEPTAHIRRTARTLCIKLIADQRATHPHFDFSALRSAWRART